jgi:hypothetical protein
MRVADVKSAHISNQGIIVLTSGAEPCHFKTVPVQVTTSYFPFYGSGSGCGSINNFKIKISSTQICIETICKQADLNSELFLCSHTMIPFNTNVSNTFLRPL